jgi:hypothetical protein
LPCQHREERHKVSIVWEESIVVEIDVITCSCAAGAAREHAQEVNKVLVIGEETVGM